MKKTDQKTPEYVVYALYKFVTLKDYEALRDPLRKLMDKFNVRGTLLLAEEGCLLYTSPSPRDRG